jgi:hypothetical protein
MSFSSFLTELVADPLSVTLSPSGPTIQLAWPSAITNGTQGQVLPEYEVQYSADLRSWKPIGGKVRALSGVSGPLLSLSLDRQGGPIFYRVIADMGSATPNETGDGGAQLFGYDNKFGSELSQVELLSHQ